MPPQTPRFASQPGGAAQQPKVQTPLLVHLDVNKTVIQSDSIQMKGIEDGIREGIAELFWGFTFIEDGKMIWEWAGKGPSCYPNVEEGDDESKKLMNYFEYCRKVVQDKANRKEIIKTFKLVGEDARVEMDKLLQVTMKKMQLPADIRYTKAAEEAGLRGSTVGIFPTLFHFVAALQRSKRSFAILFRSFGADHEKIKLEWNSFCEMRHPVYSKFIEGVGPLDGTRPGIPDRRIQSFHTIYRDAEGPVLILETFTNGPNEKAWDSWAKSKPKPTTDTRDGRTYIKNVLQAKTIDGMENLTDWMRIFTDRQQTAAIKDDWAWWQWHGETAEAGKLLILFGEPGEYEHLFFDDNIEIADTRIVDCRDNKGRSIDSEAALNKICTKVNPVEALLDDGYFLRKLQLCHGEHLDVGASLMEFQRQLAELEDTKGGLLKKVKALTMQLKTLTDENRRMKLLHRINVRSEGHLREVLSKEFDLETFGKNGFSTISDLFWEVEQGHCWLEQDETGKIIRSFEMAFIKVHFDAGGGGGNLILVESHEQSSDGRVQFRNYLPGVRKSLKESTFQSALDRWLESGIGVHLNDIINSEIIPVFTPDAPNQQTIASQAYPIPCKIQQSEVKFIISNKAQMTHQEVLGKIGLPAGKHFTKVDKDTEIPGTSGVTRFFRWDKVATWEASLAGGVQNQKGQEVNIQEVCEKLFKAHPHQAVYETLLLQMFEIFTAKKLCGGFSGSVVIRVQPFDELGKPTEACIVKLDAGEAIREEYINSANVFAALPDRAARIIGDAAYAFNKAGKEFGAMRLELAGACWNVPELAQGSANLLSTFKDLLLYESEQVLVGSSGSAGDVRPFGNVNSVLAETFGPGGVVASLRKGGAGLRRSMGKPLPTTGKGAWYTLKGKESKFNPYTAKEKYPPEPAMRRMYKQFFGEEMPDMKALVVDNIKVRLQELAEKTQQMPDLCPLVGLAHGDLNAANIMIDALDAVWLIDFATSVELPLFTDLCKFEMACLFEYATIPITPRLLLEFASSERNNWSAFNVGDWLRTKQDIAELLVRHLADLGLNQLSGMSKEQLNKLIEDVVSKSGREPEKQREATRALKARLTHDEAEMGCAFSYCRTISNTLLQGDYIFDTLNITSVPHPDSAGQKGALSLKFFMDIAASIRRFMYNDVMSCFRSHAPDLQGLQACEALSLQMWLPILRESYRLIGYGDVPPQQKIWSIYHCSCVAKNVLRSLEMLNKSHRMFNFLPTFKSLKSDLANTSSSSSLTRGDFFPQRKGFKETESRWIYSHKDMFPAPNPFTDKVVHKVHANDSLYCKKAGLFAPIYQVVTLDGTPMQLLFEPNPSGDWTLYLHEDADDVGPYFSSEEAQSLFDPQLLNGIGAVRVDQNGLPIAVVLSTRLLYVTTTLVNAKWKTIDNAKSDYEKVSDSFELAEWSNLFAKGNAETSAPKKLADHHTHMGAPRPGTEHFDFFKFLTVPALARRKNTEEGAFSLNLVLGNPALCYPPGSKLCIDTSSVVQQRSFSCEVVVLQLQDSGLYRVGDALNPGPENEREFTAVYGNHVYLTDCKYKLGEKIIFNTDKSSWVDCEVSKLAQAGVQYRHLLSCTVPSMPAILSGGINAPVQSQKEEKESILRHLNYFNSGPSWMPASIYEEEVNKIKIYMRARHSSIIDALSGSRLGVKSCCAPPTLRVAFKEKDFHQSALPAASPSRKSISLDVAATDRLRAEMDNRQGWSLVTSAVERYDRTEESCSPNTFLIFGAPGSGKSCLICRLIMDCLESCQNLVPVLLTVSDLVKRSEHDADIHGSAVGEWFDKYLRLTFGEDSYRYKMLRQAISMHRAVFLVEGLEDGGALTAVIEQFLRDLVMDRHLVVITSRPLPPGSCSLEGQDEYITTLDLQNLTEEQQRSIAHARLGLDGLNSFDQFFKSLRQSHSSTGSDEAVFGNPMMLSMLLCYLSMEQQKKDERGASPGEDDEDSVTITDVYRVAVDVMLNRVQSKQQADRHNKQKKVDECMRIVEKMAMKMQVKKGTSIEVSEFEKDLQPELRSTWESLHSAVQADNAVFLRSTTDGTKSELHFLVRGFQVFFAASEIANDGSEGKNLPGLKALLTEPEWAKMLSMLAEHSPHRYKSFFEHHLEKFEPENGNNFLHIAAKEGHRPVFQLLKLFSEAHQAALSMPNSENQMPLHLAAAEGNLQICSLMIQNSAPVDAEDKEERLPMHVALQCKHFKTAKFLLERYMETKEHHDHDSKRRSTLSSAVSPAEMLASKILDESKEFTESDFRKLVAEIFAELKFFAESDVPRKQAVGSLLSVYWICRGHYDHFVRPQPEAERLTTESWGKLQDWTKNEVQVTNSPATLGAMLVFVAIMGIGKIKALRAAFAPDIDEPNEALSSILHKFPSLITSFAKLDINLQQMILSSLKSSEFNFGQFLQAENLPASLVIVKQILGEQVGASASVLNFFLFKIFGQMCGLFSMKSMEGSLFMNNLQYTIYSLGLGVLQHLMHENAQEVYNRFLGERAKDQGLAFNANDKASRALVRIACLTRVQDAQGGKEVLEAFQALEPAERDMLTDFLNADGIDQKGFLLYNSPELMAPVGGRNNKQIGLLRPMKMLLKVYCMAAEEYENSEQLVVTIMVQELAQYAKSCYDPESFEFTKFEIARTAGSKSDCQGSVKLSPWQLMRDKEKLEEITNAGTDLVSDTMDHVLREPSFLQKLPSVFPEMKFYTFCADDLEAKKALKQTRGALLSVYWAASEQGEAFSRGQAADKKLSEKSWKAVMDMNENLSASVLDVVYVVAMVHALGKIRKFREQLAPNAIGHRQVLAHVMASCPEVLPSYMRLPQPERELARLCATVDFSFEQFMTGEALPGNLIALQEMFNEARNIEDVDDFLPVYLVCCFAELSGSLGYESLEGSLYMTEDMFAKFRCCSDAIQRLWEGGPGAEPVAVYKQMLQGSAENLGLPWEAKKPEVVAGVRVACLAQVTNTLDGITMSKIVTEFDAKERAVFSMYLTADGISEKPGFILSGCPSFLTACRKNSKVGLKACAQILLKVYVAASQRFQGSTRPIITIRLEKLTACAVDFTGSGAFQDMPFELHRMHDAEAFVVPKVWIPVSDKAVLSAMHEQGLELASDVLQNKMSEESFRARLMRTFPELSYFSPQARPQHDQTICALLSIFWLLSNNYEAFVRSQPPDDQLTKKSWAWIQEWIVTTVKLSTPEAVDAALVFMAIHALGKIPEFQEELAPNCSVRMHDVALAQILEEQPQVVPSFSRLSDSYRSLITDALGVDFQFAQFLQAENTPANLVLIQDRLKPHGDDGFAFFCFRIFVQICGKAGGRSFKGSLFMTESQFKRFRPGLVVLQRIMTVGAIQTYQNFLLQRSSEGMAHFASPEHQALARLLCLGCAFNPEDGAGICLAFDELHPSERATLTRMLNADGVEQQPDYVLSGATDLIINAKANKAVTLTDALRMLLAVQRGVLEAVGDEQPPSKVTVHLQEVATWAKRAGPNLDDFLAAALAVRAESHTVFSVSVTPFTAEMISPTSDRTTAAAFNFGPTNGHSKSLSVVSESSSAPQSTRVKQAWEPKETQMQVLPTSPSMTPPPPMSSSNTEAVSPQKRGAPPPQVNRTHPASARSHESSTPPVSDMPSAAFNQALSLDSTVTSSSRTPRTPYVAPVQTVPAQASQALSSARAAPVVIAPARSLTPVGRIAGQASTPPHPGPVGLGIANRQNSFSTSSLISAKATPPLPARIHNPWVDHDQARAAATITPIRTPSQPSLAQPSGAYGSVGPSRQYQRSPSGASLISPSVYLSAASADSMIDPASVSPKILLPCPSVVSPERQTPNNSGRRTPAAAWGRADAAHTPGVAHTPTAVASQPPRMLSRGPACHSTPILGSGFSFEGAVPVPVTTRTLTGTASPRASPQPTRQFNTLSSVAYIPGTDLLQHVSSQLSTLQASAYPVSPAHAISPKHARPFR